MSLKVQTQILILIATTVRVWGQESTGCSQSEPCPPGHFCTYKHTIISHEIPLTPATCEACIAHPDACPLLGLPDAGIQDCAAKCDPASCSNADPPCPEGFFCNRKDIDEDGGGNANRSVCELCVPSDTCSDLGLSQSAASDCEAACPEGTQNKCSLDSPCPEEETFCSFQFGDDGICEPCVPHPHLCFDLGLSTLGENDCTSSCLASKYDCYDLVGAKTTVDGEVYPTTNGIIGSPLLSSSGPLVDCGLAQSTCEGAEGAVCLIRRTDEHFQEHDANSKKVLSCERGGGVAAIIYNYEPGSFLSVLWGNSDGSEIMETVIPSISMSGEDGEYILRNELGKIAEIETFDGGEICEDAQGCSGALPCPEGWFCNFDWDDHGFCQSCSSINADDCLYNGLPQLGAEQCDVVCGSASRISFPACKFCPDTISLSDIGSESDGGTCEFCPHNDMKYANNKMRMFGPNVNCDTIDNYFRKYHVDPTDQRCKLAQMQSHICGCTGPGYVGANTETKRSVLVWLPRVTALLSFAGSATIIIDVTRSESRRNKLVNQLMVVLSIFDLFGSAAYAFTTLPLPQDDYIQGSKGNAATCSAQGFFIQMGATSAYINVSLAVYYLFVLKLGWSEHQVKKVKIWFFLCPISIGMAFAFAGIPFYDNMILWCNNGAEIWPEIPMAISIFFATIIMGAVCLHVYREESASNKWRVANNNNNGAATSSGKVFWQAIRRTGGDSTTPTIARKVFWQAIWYLVAFYMTWPPYLVLQYLWVSGKAFSMYGFVLYAGTVVPMQGFWNLIVYWRRTRSITGAFDIHVRQSATKLSRTLSRTASALLKPGLKRMSSSTNKKNLNAFGDVDEADLRDKEAEANENA